MHLNLIVAFDKAGYAVVIFHLGTVHLSADFPVYQRPNHYYAPHDIEPKHQDYYGCEGALNKRIFNGKADEPGENKAYHGEQQ